MEQHDLIDFVVDVMSAMKLRYFITGSTATIYYGEPRFTNDVDIVVDLPANKVMEFCGTFPPSRFYVSPEAAHDAISHKSQFNIIEPATGLKADIIVPTPDDFNRSRFARIRRLNLASGRNAWFASAEDVIIKKMLFYREGRSEKHLRDIIGVLRVCGEDLDRAYIARWAAVLGAGDIWIKVCQLAVGESK
ncbi:MAG: hypothetical protein ACP5QA_15940 [Phycisphaerae bacterium]